MMITKESEIPTVHGGTLMATEIPLEDFPMDISNLAKVKDAKGKLRIGDLATFEVTEHQYEVIYFGKKCLTEVPTKQDWQDVVDEVKKSGRKVIGLLCNPCYIPMIHYENEEDSPTIQQYLDGTYVNKGKTVAMAIFYPAVEVQ